MTIQVSKQGGLHTHLKRSIVLPAQNGSNFRNTIIELSPLSLQEKWRSNTDY